MQDVFLDTNLLARFLLGDVMEQHNQVLELFQKAKEEQFCLQTLPEVFIELYYVLKTIYKIEKADIIASFTSILNFSFVHCQNYEIFLQSLEIFNQTTISLEDCYYLVYSLTNELEFRSFDKQAKKVYNHLKLSAN